jgi:NTE family protein
LPVPVRAMLRGMGVTGQGRDARGAALASYLLFEAPYTRALMALGEADAMARREEVVAFFGWQRAAEQSASTPVARAASAA